MSGRQPNFGKYKPGACMFCEASGLGLNLIDITVVSKFICQNCANELTIERFHNAFKWQPTITYNKALNQVLKIKTEVKNDNKSECRNGL